VHGHVCIQSLLFVRMLGNGLVIPANRRYGVCFDNYLDVSKGWLQSSCPVGFMRSIIGCMASSSTLKGSSCHCVLDLCVSEPTLQIQHDSIERHWSLISSVSSLDAWGRV